MCHFPPTVETIGDAYMATTNVVKNQPDHAIRLVRFGLAALAAASETLIDEHDVSKGFITIRVRGCVPWCVRTAQQTRTSGMCIEFSLASLSLA